MDPKYDLSSELDQKTTTTWRESHFTSKALKQQALTNFIPAITPKTSAIVTFVMPFEDQSSPQEQHRSHQIPSNESAISTFSFTRPGQGGLLFSTFAATETRLMSSETSWARWISIGEKRAFFTEVCICKSLSWKHFKSPAY